MVSSEPSSMITVKSEVLLASAQKSPANTRRAALSLITKNQQAHNASSVAAENLSAQSMAQLLQLASNSIFVACTQQSWLQWGGTKIWFSLRDSPSTK